MNRKSKAKKLFEGTQKVSTIRALYVVAILAIAVLVVPVCAQSGNLGHNPAYPEFPQKEVTPDYLLVDGDKVSLKTISDSGEIVDECVLCG